MAMLVFRDAACLFLSICGKSMVAEQQSQAQIQKKRNCQMYSNTLTIPLVIDNNFSKKRFPCKAQISGEWCFGACFIHPVQSCWDLKVQPRVLTWVSRAWGTSRSSPHLVWSWGPGKIQVIFNDRRNGHKSWITWTHISNSNFPTSTMVSEVCNVQCQWDLLGSMDANGGFLWHFKRRGPKDTLWYLHPVPGRCLSITTCPSESSMADIPPQTLGTDTLAKSWRVLRVDLRVLPSQGAEASWGLQKDPSAGDQQPQLGWCVDCGMTNAQRILSWSSWYLVKLIWWTCQDAIRWSPSRLDFGCSVSFLGRGVVRRQFHHILKRSNQRLPCHREEGGALVHWKAHDGKGDDVGEAYHLCTLDQLGMLGRKVVRVDECRTILSGEMERNIIRCVMICIHNIYL